MSPTIQNNTIFLTPEEDARLRKNFKDRLQKCRELSGQLRVPSDPQFLRSQVIYADLMSDMQPGPKAQKVGASSIVAYAVGTPYPPCTVPLQDLKPMGMHELRMDTHHRGRVLTVRRWAATPVIKLKICSWTVVQEVREGGEGGGEVDRLEVGLCKEVHGVDILESGEVFKVLEPWFTVGEQGEPTIRIDHRSDLVCIDCTPSTADKSGRFKNTRIDVTKIAREYKEEGNAALKQRNLPLAYSKYTRGLELLGAAKEDIAYDLFRNRAHVNLLLDRLDGGKSDALAALTGLPDQKHRELDGKAYLRAGIAAYQSGDFQEAKHLFEEQQRLLPGEKEATVKIRKTEQRLKEQETGCYDFKKLKASLLLPSSSRHGTRVDAASFTRNVEVKSSPGKGRGLFATRDLEAGEVIMAEKSFCIVWANEEEALTSMTYDFRDDRIRVFPAGLCKAVVRRLIDNPSQVSKFLDLYGDYRGTESKGQSGRDGDWGKAIDVFQVHDVVARNAFGPDPRSASAGLWILASYINHSCLPNSEKEYVGDLMLLRATRSIAAGEEILHAYDLSSDYDARVEALMRTWGFSCDCKLCVAEKADSEEVRSKRRELEREADALIEKREGSRLAIVKVRRLMREIEGTFDEERYRELPRMALTRVQRWISEAGKR
jgi:tetratricopeptide (TPR) repeat protein